MEKRRGEAVIPAAPKASSSRAAEYEPAAFLTIDLDVRSRFSLAALFAEWPSADRPVRMNGRPDPKWVILRPRGTARTADKAAQMLLEDIERLPRTAKRSWKRATKRTFDIGIQAGFNGRAFESAQLEPATLKRIAAVGGRVQVTVYPPVRAEGARS